MILTKDRRHAEEEINTLERAISLLGAGSRLPGDRGPSTRIGFLGRALGHTLASYERDLDRVS